MLPDPPIGSPLRRSRLATSCFENLATALLERSRQVGLKFNPAKLKLREDKVNYVGHVLSSQGVRPDPEKIKGIINMPPPTDKEGVQKFL